MACSKFEMQYVGSDVKNIRYRVTSNPNITTHKSSKLKKFNENYITLPYTTLHYAIYITIQYIEVTQKHATVLMGRCAKFGKLIRKRKYGGGGGVYVKYRLRDGGGKDFAMLLKTSDTFELKSYLTGLVCL